MCGDSILSCCPRNPHGHERALKEEKHFTGPLIKKANMTNFKQVITAISIF